MSNAANETCAIEKPLAGIVPSGRISSEERLITLTEAAKILPKVNGKKPAVCTLWRWCRKGLRGVFLEYVRVGRKICTTREALLRFFSGLAELDERVNPNRYSKPPALKRTPITSRQRQRALAEADAERPRRPHRRAAHDPIARRAVLRRRPPLQ